MAPKSIFRQPGTVRFQLVHRSQRDPLIHDTDVSKHVLKPVPLKNSKNGQSLADLEKFLPVPELDLDLCHKFGEASIYGIYYDDTEYDYMQHLRQVGTNVDNVESIMIEAPLTKVFKKTIKYGELVDLPLESLPSATEVPGTYESQQSIPESIAGFQPDMDPHLRQTLEALEDDDFVDHDIQESFFSELLADGERAMIDDVKFDFYENGAEAVVDLKEHEDGWEHHFRKFKEAQEKSDFGNEGSEGEDTVGKLPSMSVGGRKRKRRLESDVSGHSMSSSSLLRTDTLQTLDECFRQMVLTEYREECPEYHSEPSRNRKELDEVPELITSRSDFASMVDEFLNNYEVLGSKIRLKIAENTSTGKLGTILFEVGQDQGLQPTKKVDNDEEYFFPIESDCEKDRWDCETILSTYSNLENHPRIIRFEPKKKTVHHSGTGTLVYRVEPEFRRSTSGQEFKNDSGSETDAPRRQTISRSRHESKEEKKERKAAVKAEHRIRKIEKKLTKEQFSAEMKSQRHNIADKERRMMRL